MTKLIINTDGAARGNPGPAAASFIIRKEGGEVLAQAGVILGVATNNVAEYQAVKLALEKMVQELAGNLPAEVEIRSDSRLIVEQLSGNFKIKNDNLKVLFAEVKALESRVGNVYYIQIPRTANAAADRLANIALDRRVP